MNKYCLIANYHLTPLQIKLAKSLERLNISVCWIVVNERLYSLIHNSGWASCDILYLSLPSSNSFKTFTEAPLKFNDLLIADRALRHDVKIGIAYLHTIADKINNFLKDQKPNFIFGEITWAHERITAALCKFHGDKTYLSPHTVRFPAGRWGFFIGEDQTDLYISQHKNNQVITNDSLEVVQPAYVKRNDELIKHARTLRARISRIRRFLTRENISSGDPTHIQSRAATLKIAGAEEINRVLYRFVNRTEISPEMLARPFVLYALHKQPESSIDVLGRYYEDQLSIIRAVWRTLPAGWFLYIKEHSNAIGDRSMSFYRKVQKLPNTYLVSEKAPAANLIKASKAVFTITGSIAYEAALMGKPSFTFAPMFFNRFKFCKEITINSLRNCTDLRELIALENTRAIEDPEKYVFSHSFEGVFTDVFTDPNVMQNENMEKLTEAFLNLNRN